MTSELYAAANDLLLCAAAALKPTELGVPPSMRVSLTPGTPADDDCCAGQLAVYVISMYPSNIFPTQDISTANCGAPYTAVVFGVRITRCGPSPDTGGELPSPAELQVAARGIYEDAWAVWTGVRCCLQDWQRLLTPREGVLGIHAFFEPQGGCIGSELQVTVGISEP